MIYAIQFNEIDEKQIRRYRIRTKKLIYAFSDGRSIDEISIKNFKFMSKNFKHWSKEHRNLPKGLKLSLLGKSFPELYPKTS